METKKMNRQHSSARKALQRYISENREFFALAVTSMVGGPRKAMLMRDLLR